MGPHITFRPLLEVEVSHSYFGPGPARGLTFQPTASLTPRLKANQLRPFQTDGKLTLWHGVDHRPDQLPEDLCLSFFLDSDDPTLLDITRLRHPLVARDHILFVTNQTHRGTADVTLTGETLEIYPLGIRRINLPDLFDPGTEIAIHRVWSGATHWSGTVPKTRNIALAGLETGLYEAIGNGTSWRFVLCHNRKKGRLALAEFGPPLNAKSHPALISLRFQAKTLELQYLIHQTNPNMRIDQGEIRSLAGQIAFRRDPAHWPDDPNAWCFRSLQPLPFALAPPKQERFALHLPEHGFQHPDPVPLRPARAQDLLSEGDSQIARVTLGG